MTSLPLLLLLSIDPAAAAGPGSGTLSKRNIKIGSCLAKTVTVKYELDSLMGEPTVAGSLKWEGDECKLPSSTTIWLEVKGGNQKGYVRISPATPKAGGGYGYNTTGSPNWSKTLCGYRGTDRTECLTKDRAIELWKSGSVTSFHIAW